MQRHLAAIFAADIVGYASLMGQDQQAMLQALKRFRTELFDPTVAGHRGKIVKSMGDGWLAEFQSAADAVTCAMHVQDRLAGHRNIRLRIGVHIGDVVHEGQDILGDGVNVAARLETFAEPGAVAISESAYFSLDGTLRPSFDDAGTHELKNIDRPVQIWSRAPKLADLPADLSDTGFPTITIAPISTSDQRPDVRELAAALTDDLRTYLGSSSWMHASISDDSGQSIYVLRGVLRARGDRLRLDARLLASEGGELWVGKFDSNLDDAFDWQDEVSGEITAQAIAPIFEAEQAKLALKTEPELSWGELMLAGYLALFSLNADAVGKATYLFSRAINSAPAMSMAYSQAIRCYLHARQWSFTSTVEKHAREFQDWRQTASHLPSSGALHDLILAIIDYQEDRDTKVMHSKLEAILRRAPFDAEVLTYCGMAYMFLDEPRTVLECLDRSERYGRLAPFAPLRSLVKGVASVQIGNLEEAVECVEKIMGVIRDAPSPYLILTSAYALLGRTDDAERSLREVLNRIPDETVSTFLSRTGYVTSTGMQRFCEGLRLAGLPD